MYAAIMLTSTIFFVLTIWHGKQWMITWFLLILFIGHMLHAYVL